LLYSQGGELTCNETLTYRIVLAILIPATSFRPAANCTAIDHYAVANS